jgi:hypothetical protein
LTLTMLVYLGIKLAMTTGRIPTHVSVLHILTFPIVSSLLGLCATATVQGLGRHPRLGPMLGLIAGLTLEIYLVHGFVYANRRVAALPFPVNIVAFWAATLPLAWLLSIAARRARDWGRLGSSRGESGGRIHVGIAIPPLK